MRSAICAPRQLPVGVYDDMKAKPMLGLHVVL